MWFRVETPQGVRIIGKVMVIDGRKVLIKRVRRKEHFMRELRAWGLQGEVIPKLKALGVEAVRLEVDDGSILEAPVVALETFGFRRDFGHGEQVFLPEHHWKVVRPPRDSAEQLTLWAAGGAL